MISSIKRLASGNIISQVAAFAILPIILKIYSPEQYGVSAQILAIAAIVSPIALLRLDFAVAIAEEQEIPSLRRTAILSSLSVSFLCGALSSIYFTGYIVPVFLSLTVFALSLNQFLVAENLRLGNLNKVNLSKILFPTISGAMQILISFSFFRPIGLIIGDVIGRYVSNLAIRPAIDTEKPFSSLELIKKYQSFIKYSMPASIMNSISIFLPTIFISHSFSVYYSGIFSLSLRVIQTPISSITQSTSQAFFAAAKSNIELNILKSQTLKLVKMLFVISIAVTLLAPVLYIIIKDLIPPKWEDCVLTIVILWPMFFSQIALSSITSFFNLVERNSTQFMLDFFRISGILIASLASNILNATYWEYITAISILSTLYYFVYFFTCLKYFKETEGE